MTSVCRLVTAAMDAGVAGEISARMSVPTNEIDLILENT